MYKKKTPNKSDKQRKFKETTQLNLHLIVGTKQHPDD